MKTRMELLRALAQECARMDAEFGERGDSNYGVYRLATHDGANYVYLSNFYGWAMSTIDPAGLTDDQLRELIQWGMCY